MAEEPGLVEVQREIGFDCTSGRHINAMWTGFPIVPLIESVGISDGTTHLIIESRDDQRGCIPITNALEGILAFTRDGEILEGPRFVAQGIAGPRAVKLVRRIEAVELDQGTERSGLENFTIDPEERDRID